MRKKNSRKLLRCDAREGTNKSLRFQMSILWNCGFKCLQSGCFPTLTSLFPSLSIYQHIMKRVDLHFHKCWLQWIQLLPVGFWQHALLGINLQFFLSFQLFFFYLRTQMSLSPQAKCKTENSGVYITFKDKWHEKGNVFVLEALDRGKTKGL